jgi:hypothetical protein
MSGVDNMSEVGGPTHQIVGDPRADQPAAVGGEVPEGDMGQGEVFEVFDGELDRRMVAVKGVDIVNGHEKVPGFGRGKSQLVAMRSP